MSDETNNDETSPSEPTSRRNLFRAVGATAGVIAGGGLLSVLRAGPAGALHTPQTTGLFWIFNNPVRQYDSRLEPPPAPGLLVGGAEGTTRTVALPVTNPPLDPGAQDRDIVALLMNITVSDTSGHGYLVIHPTGFPRPNTSIINWWGPGQVHANMVTSAVAGPAFGLKTVDVFISANSSCHLIIDAYGYYEAP